MDHNKFLRTFRIVENFNILMKKKISRHFLNKEKKNRRDEKNFLNYKCKLHKLKMHGMQFLFFHLHLIKGVLNSH